MISIVIPVKNRSEKLKKSIQSVLNQTYTDIEILVVDDKSSEDLKVVVNDFKDNRIKYILNQSKVSNANVCRNIGLDIAKGEFIAMIDSDDIWKSNHLEYRLDFLQKTGADGCFGSVEIYRDGTYKQLISREILKNEKFIDYLFSGGFAPTPTHFYKSKAAKKIRYNEQYFRHQDWDFSLRFSRKFSFIPCDHVSCVVNWSNNEVKVHSNSSKLFYETYSIEMSEKSKKFFLMSIINQLYVRKFKKDLLDVEFFIKQFLFESLKISFSDFVSIQIQQKGIFKLINRIKYLKYLFSLRKN